MFGAWGLENNPPLITIFCQHSCNFESFIPQELYILILPIGCRTSVDPDYLNSLLMIDVFCIQNSFVIRGCRMVLWQNSS